MLIDAYFQQVRELIAGCTEVQDFNLACEKRGTYEGFIRGNVNFTDGSLLHLREFVYVETTLDRKMYSYQYMDASKVLIFRYDNADHRPQLNLRNYPHHKHEGSEDNILSSDAPMLGDVLREIEYLL